MIAAALSQPAAPAGRCASSDRSLGRRAPACAQRLPATHQVVRKGARIQQSPSRRGGIQLRRASEAKSAEAEVAAEEEKKQGAPAAPAQVFDADDKLNDWELLRIVTQDIPDEAVNDLVWECLGYVKSVEMDPETLTVETKWDTTNVFPKWRAKFPTPPDLLGVTRKYYPEIDAPIKEANSALARSIPQEYKQGLKQALRPLGWSGFKLDSLTPNKTRRAQVANWLVFYRSELRGVSLEELQRRKAEKQANEEASEVKLPTGTTKQGVI